MGKIEKQIIEDTIKPDYQDEVYNLLLNNKLGIYNDFLIREIKTKSVNLLKILNYAFNELNEIKSRPNIELSKLFFILSSFSNISNEISSFAMDAMLFCENFEEDGLSVDLISLRKEYNRIYPRLK